MRRRKRQLLVQRKKVSDFLTPAPTFIKPSTKRLASHAGLGDKLHGYEGMKDFVQSLEKPRWVPWQLLTAAAVAAVQGFRHRNTPQQTVLVRAIYSLPCEHPGLY